MKCYIFVILNLYIITNCAFTISSISTPIGFQETTCTGSCCTGTAGCLTTTPRECALTYGGNFNGVFTTCSGGSCPNPSVINLSRGCTYYNSTDGTYTTWFGYTSIANVPIIIPHVQFGQIGNVFHNAAPYQSPPTTFHPGTFLNQFSVIGLSGPVLWNVTYAGSTSIVQGDPYTTCVHYCCNSTYCITTNNTCDQAGITSGIVSSGSYFENPGVGSSCAGGQTITSETVFPCSCTSSTNNGGPCGSPRNITLFFGCKIANQGGNGLCTIPVGYHNPNNETYIVEAGINNYAYPIPVNGSITTVFQPGYHPNSENITWLCPGGTGGLTRKLLIHQVFANY